MKPSTVLLPSNNDRNEETTNKGMKRLALKSLFFMFLLASVMLFASCYATVSTPRVPRARHGVVIIGSDDGGRHDNGNQYRRDRRRENRERRERGND